MTSSHLNFLLPTQERWIYVDYFIDQLIYLTCTMKEKRELLNSITEDILIHSLDFLNFINAPSHVLLKLKAILPDSKQFIFYLRQSIQKQKCFITPLPILGKCSLSIPPQGVHKGNIGLKWVNNIPVGIQLLKFKNRNTRARCKICSKLSIRTRERR